MSVRAGREFLAIPGPTTVPDEVLRAMHRPAVEIYSGPLLALTEGLMRDLVHAPVKKNILITDATHFVIFEKKRFEFFDQILKFMRE